MPADSQPGPRPVWNWLAVAFTLGVLVVLFAPAAPELREENRPAPTFPPGQTITLDELQALLTDAPGEPPPSVVVETPDGPMTVVVPSTTTTTTAPATTTTTTTTTAAPTTTRPLPTADDLIDNLLGQSAPPTIPEVVGDGRP